MYVKTDIYGEHKMDEQELRDLISHILFRSPLRQAVPVLSELLELLKKEDAGEDLLELTENSIRSAAELRSLLILGRTLSREEMESAFFRSRELAASEKRRS